MLCGRGLHCIQEVLKSFAYCGRRTHQHNNMERVKTDMCTWAEWPPFDWNHDQIGIGSSISLCNRPPLSYVLVPWCIANNIQWLSADTPTAYLRWTPRKSRSLWQKRGRTVGKALLCGHLWRSHPGQLDFIGNNNSKRFTGCKESSRPSDFDIYYMRGNHFVFIQWYTLSHSQ
jgi:hypothetical protein